MFAPQKIKEEEKNTGLDFLRAEQAEMSKAFMSGDKSRNAEIKAFNEKWLAAGGVWGSCISEIK